MALVQIGRMMTDLDGREMLRSRLSILCLDLYSKWGGM
jgi:hypothetical protein